jgi:hypothetical protein
MTTYRGLCAWPIMQPRGLVVGRPRPPIYRRFSRSSTHPCPGLGLERIGLMVWGPCGSVSAAKVQGRAALLGERSIGRHWATSLAGREEKGRTKRWRAGEDCAVGPGQCCSIALLVVVVAGAFRQPARHPRTSPKGLRRCSVSSTRHAHAGQLSCPTPHQLLDFLHQRDSCVAGPPPPSRRTQRFEVGSPALSLPARRRLGIGVVLYCDATLRAGAGAR